MSEEQDVPVGRTVIVRGPRTVVRQEVVIKDFENEMEIFKPGKSVESRSFKVKNNTFAITVSPNGDTEDFAGYVSVHLVKKSVNEVTITRLKITIGEKTVEGKNKVLGTGVGRIMGINKCCKHDRCKSVLKNGDLVVKVEVMMIGDLITIDRSDAVQEKSSSWVLENMYRRRMKDSDFVLMCEGEAIHCHKNVLTSASEYFEGLLKPNFKENQEGSSRLQCSAEVGKNLVEFIYTDDIEEAVFNNNIEEFLKLGDMLMMKRLKQRAEQRMLQLLDRHNMAAFFIAGAAFKAGAIKKAAKEFLQANLEWLHKQENWKEAFGEHKDLLIEVYSE